MKIGFWAAGGLLGAILLVVYLTILGFSGGQMIELIELGIFMVVPFIIGGIILGAVAGLVFKKNYISF